MGILDFMGLLRQQASSCLYESPYLKFKQKKMAIDISIWAHKDFRALVPGFVHENEPDSEDETEPTEGSESKVVFSIDWPKLKKRWLTKILGMAFLMLRNQITPIFIFDGKAPKLKNGEHVKREAERKRKEEIFREAEKEYLDSVGKFKKNQAREKYRSSFINQIRFDFSFIDSLREVLQGLGLPMLQCVEETDYLVAALVKENLIEACYSTDTDLLIYGVKYLLTGTYQGNFNVVDREEMMKVLDLTNEELIDLAIFMGCDYNRKLDGVGKGTAFPLIEEFRQLELFPARYYSPGLKRTVVRERFENIPPWEDLVELEKSNIGEATVENLVFKKEVYLRKGLKALQKVGLSDYFEQWKVFFE
jgi:5'-3' exonuclease